MKNARKLVIATIAISMAFTSCKKAPTAAFEVQDGTLYATKDIKFTNDSDGGGLDYAWTFEGAESTSSTQENPTAVWSTPGTYKVTLAASNKKGDHETSETITIEEYIPYVTVKNNTPGYLLVTIGTEGPSSSQSDYSWATEINRGGYAIISSGKTVDVKLGKAMNYDATEYTDHNGDSWDINAGKVYVWIANADRSGFYSVDNAQYHGKLVWTGVGESYLDYVDFDTEYTVDCSENFFHVTMNNAGYSQLNGVYAFMGESINDQQVGYANINTGIDVIKEIGYFDAYAGVKIGSFYTNVNYVYWTEGSDGQFEFADGMENFAVTLLNDTYKSTGSKKAIATSGSNGMPLDGSKVLNAPRKVKVSSELNLSTASN